MKKDITKQKTFTLFFTLGVLYITGTAILGIYYIIRLLNTKTEYEKNKIKIEINKWGKTITFIIILNALLCGLILMVKNS